MILHAHIMYVVTGMRPYSFTPIPTKTPLGVINIQTRRRFGFNPSEPEQYEILDPRRYGYDEGVELERAADPPIRAIFERFQQEH
jgi:hypothetical protein